MQFFIMSYACYCCVTLKRYVFSLSESFRKTSTWTQHSIPFPFLVALPHPLSKSTIFWNSIPSYFLPLSNKHNKKFSFFPFPSIYLNTIFPSTLGLPPKIVQLPPAFARQCRHQIAANKPSWRHFPELPINWWNG